MTQHLKNGSASTVKHFFSRETAVSIEINAPESILWALLTNAAEYPRWNPTVLSIEGTIAPGQKIRLKAALDPKRIFTLSVIEFVPETRLVWGDMMGKRVYTLTAGKNGVTTFSMREKIGGPLFPLFAAMIPSFDEAFEQFALALKTEAETISKTR